uniref:Melanocortin-2 receptor accessory protein n=1 Tax=Denticeps clupeoides TaxID=299321 RepID=A0AAY4B028_9TELE
MQNYTWSYEYYYDYIEPVAVDQTRLRYNKHSVVIVFWLVLLVFFGFFSFTLTGLSRAAPRSYAARSSVQNPRSDF